MSHETLQTSYSAKEIAPRIVIGFVTANLSMVLMSKAIDLANGLSAAFTAGGVNPQSAATVADDHAGQLGQLRRDLPDPAGPGRGRARPGARGGLRDPADGRGAAGRRRPGPARPVRPAADRLGRPLVVAGADRRPGHPGRPGPGDDRRRAGVLLPRLAARRHQQHPGADPDHLVPAVHPDAHPVLDRAPRPVPVRAVPAAPRRPVRRHRRRLVPHRPAAARHRRGRGQGAARERAAHPGEPAAGPARGPGPARHRAGSAAGRPRYVQPPLPGMPSPPRYRQLALFDVPPRADRQPPGPAPGPPPAPPRSTRPRYRQPPLPGMPAPPRRPGSSRSPSTRRPGRAAPGSPPEGNRRELRRPRPRADPLRRRAPGQDPRRADRPPGRDRRSRRGDHLGGLPGHPARDAAARVRRARLPGRPGRRRPGHRRARRPAAGPAAGRRLAAAARPAPPGHRPRGHPGPARLDRPARPAGPAPGGARAAVAARRRPTG